jgi:hypothetical protein
MDMLGQTEPPASLPETYVLSVAVDCILGIADSISKLVVVDECCGEEKQVLYRTWQVSILFMLYKDIRTFRKFLE